jgi:thiol-disulfide isomerase/thioredoxin
MRYINGINNKIKFYVFVCVLVLLSLLAGIWLYIKITQANPQYSSNNKSNNNLNAEYKELIAKNNLTVLNFWASWCEPCKKEIPLLNAISEQQNTIKTINTINILGIAIDSKDNVDKFKLKTPLNYMNIIDANNGLNIAKNIGNNMGVLPYTVVMDSKENILMSFVGELSNSDIDKIKQIKLSNTIAIANSIK